MNAAAAFQCEITKYHSEISSHYGPVGVSFEKLNTSSKASAFYVCRKKEIVYDAEKVAFLGIKRIVLHEFAHHIQSLKFGYTSHDFLFCLINQMLNVKHISAQAFNLSIYDIQDATELHNEELNFFFIADEIARISTLDFYQAVTELKILEIALIGEREFEDFEFSTEKIEEIRKRKINYKNVKTNIKKNKKAIWLAD